MKKETENKIIELQKMVNLIEAEDRIKQELSSMINDILACEANDVKCGKVDLYKYVLSGKEAQSRKAISGVYHSCGKVYATDGHILLRLTQGYALEREGKIIDKNGQEVDARYVNADAVVPKPEGRTAVEIDFVKVNLMRKKWTAHKKIYKDKARGRVIIGHQEFDIPHFLKTADVMKELCIGEVLQYPKDTVRPLLAHNDGNDIVLMPLTPCHEEMQNKTTDRPELMFFEL
jgi:hypothetical protein